MNIDFSRGGTLPNTPENVAMAESAKDWLDSLVSDVFADYCKTFEIFYDYGVSDYSIRGDEISVTQACRNGDSEYYSLSVQWLYMDQEERKADMVIQKHKKDGETREQTIKATKARLESLDREAQRLRDTLKNL